MDDVIPNPPADDVPALLVEAQTLVDQARDRDLARLTAPASDAVPPNPMEDR